jgi:quinol monooxygenase YgiN
MIRIVKMTFKQEYITQFEKLFDERKLKIRAAQGCNSLSLLKDIHVDGIFFTYSNWEDTTYLEMYRNSELFTDTWQTIKPWFAAPAEAWSVHPSINL